MAVGGYICALIFISAAAAGGRLEKPSPSVVAELLHSPAQHIVEMEYCPPTLEDQVLKYSEGHSRIPLLCLQASYLSQADHRNGEVLEIVVLQLEISDGIKAIVESIQWHSSITASDQSAHKSEVMFDSNWTDDLNYQRWKRFLLKKLKLSPSYFRASSSQGPFPRLKRQNNDDNGTSILLATIAQNIRRGLHFAQSLKAKVEQASKQTKTVEKRIKRLSSTLSSTSESDILELQEKGKRVERLFTSINNEITTLQKQNQDLKYNIDDFNVQLTAANISQEYKNKGSLYRVSYNGDGYAMLESPVFSTSFSFSIVFRTSTPDGLLFFSSNNSMEYWYSLVLLKGKLVFRHKLADGVVEIQSSTENMNDDKWHRLDGVKTTGSLQFYVDQKLVAFKSIATSFLASVTWGPLYVGGIPDRPFYQSQKISITSFTGCLENITFNQKVSDFRNSIGLKNTEFGCTREENKAPTKPYYFNGNGYASYKLPNGGVGKNFTMKLEFKTSKREGILFSASSNKLRDALALELRFGKLLYFLDNGDGGFMVQYQGKKLHDNKWHTLLAEKWASSIRLTVDNDPPETARFAGSDQNTDTSTSLYIGGLPPKSRLPDGLTTDANFVGCMKLKELENHKCTLIQLQDCTS